MTQRNITAFFSKASNVKSVSENEESVICDFSQSKESDITSQKSKSPNLTSKQNGDNVPNKRKRSPSGKRGSPEKNTTNKKSTSEKNKISLQSCEQNEKSPTKSKQRANSLNIGKWLVATNEGRNNTGDSDEEIVPVKQRSRKMAKIESDDSSGGEETINSETKQTDNSETIPNQTAKIISEVDNSMKKETSRDGSVENEILEDKREETESSEDNSEESESSEDKSEEDESSEDKSLKIKTINVELPSKGKQIKIKITADLNVSSDKYKPSKSNYHPINDATWKRGEKVPYLALAHTLEQIEAVSSRLKIIEILSNFFRSVIVLTPDDLLPSIYLCLNKLAPAYENLELGVAETTLLKAIAQTTGRSIAQLKSDVKAAGDIGIVAEQSRSNQKLMFQPAPLTVRGVFEMLKKLTEMSGISTVSKKVGKIQSIFVACRQSEARYFIRSLAGKLRIGLAEQSVLQALAQALVTTPPGQDYPPKILNFASSVSADAFKSKLDKQALIIKTTYCECPSYDKIVPVILKEGVEALPQHCHLTPGIPLKPMLAQPTKGVSEVLQRFEGLRFTCEWKYDGERAQIHVDGTKVYIFSRNQENNTTKYPDITTRLNQCICPGVSSCVLDTEVVAWDTQNKRILPFQVLSTRKRKDCSESEIKVAVCVYIFDLLYLNGESLVKKPLSERRKMLLENFMVVDERFYFATNLDTSTMEEVQDFLEDAVKGNCEGLMVKTLETEATYEIAKRSRNWLKLKKDYLEGVGDTLDVVVIGGYQGRGKRTGVYGGFLLACYDEENEEYQSICKIGTGFSEEDLQKHSEFMKEHIIDAPRPYYRYDISHEPDHWFDPVQVWEIKCADLSLSPVHRAAQGIVDPEKGISLRFPRFVRIRDDKSVEQATSAKQVADMYKNQDQIKNQQGTDKFTEEDFY